MNRWMKGFVLWGKKTVSNWLTTLSQPTFVMEASVVLLLTKSVSANGTIVDSSRDNSCCTRRHPEGRSAFRSGKPSSRRCCTEAIDSVSITAAISRIPFGRSLITLVTLLLVTSGTSWSTIVWMLAGKKTEQLPISSTWLVKRGLFTKPPAYYATRHSSILVAFFEHQFQSVRHLRSGHDNWLAILNLPPETWGALTIKWTLNEWYGALCHWLIFESLREWTDWRTVKWFFFGVPGFTIFTMG